MKPRTLTIMPVLNGFVVKVDCQTVVFESRKALLSALTRYYDDPTGVEKEYLAARVNDTMSGPLLCGPLTEALPMDATVQAGPYPVGAGEERR